MAQREESRARDSSLWVLHPSLRCPADGAAHGSPFSPPPCGGGGKGPGVLLTSSSCGWVAQVQKGLTRPFCTFPTHPRSPEIGIVTFRESPAGSLLRVARKPRVPLERFLILPESGQGQPAAPSLQDTDPASWILYARPEQARACASLVDQCERGRNPVPGIPSSSTFTTRPGVSGGPSGGSDSPSTRGGWGF